MKRLFAFLCLPLFTIITTFSQEVLNDLEINPYLQNIGNKATTHKSTTAGLPLPFIDDFSYSAYIPNQDLWENRNVFVNTSYGINPPTIGVATFDAVNEFGYVYESMSQNSSPADTLTSRIIDMQNADAASTYLSFYYQPQGLGNNPEAEDSLVLNVISKDSVFRIWYANGTDYESFKKNELGIPDNSNITTLEFKLVHLKLDDPYFFSDSFQIQFINYANIPSLTARPSDRTNKDHWHIDYVKLDDNRTAIDTILNDLAMVEPSSSFLKDFSSVPWSHYSAVISSKLSDLKFHIRNNDSETRYMNELIVNITNLGSGEVVDKYIGFREFNAFSNRNDIGFSFESAPVEYDNADSAIFEISGQMLTDNDGEDPLGNNTSRRTKYICTAFNESPTKV